MNQLDRQTFEVWMRRLSERFDRLENIVIKSSKQLGSNITREPKYMNGERLYDNQDMCELLNIGKRSLQRHRTSGRLIYFRLNRKLYYKESDVMKFLEHSFEEFRGGNKIDG